MSTITASEPTVSGNGISHKSHSASDTQTFAEQKDPEIVREETVEEEEKAEIEMGHTDTDLGPSKHIDLVVTGKAIPIATKTESADASEQSAFRGLSQRASQMGEYLRSTKTVTAVLLRADGSTEEIPYDTSSTQTRELLGGSASVVGSIEGLDAIIVRAKSSFGERNAHSLPGDVKDGHRGDYLIYRADAEGTAADLTLSEYELFAAANPSSKERSADTVDAQRIRARRTDASDLVFARSEIDRVVRAELKDTSATEGEIEAAKAHVFQRVVDGVVAACASSPMADPDFDESAEAEGEAEQAVDAQIQTDATQTDSRHWRLQLNDALRFVRARGRADGQRLAQQISSTFFELNAKEPSHEELKDIFGGIQAELAAEAQRDLTSTADIDTDTVSAANSAAQRLAHKFSTASAAELVEHSRAIVEQDLVQRARSLLRSVHGREGDDDEVRATLRDLAFKLAEAALEANARSDSDDTADDADYNPENAADARLHRHDVREDREHAEEHFEGKREEDEFVDTVVLTSATTRSRLGFGEAFSVYFDEHSKKSDLATALRMFEKRNGRAPTQIEQARVRQFLATQDTVDVVPVENEKQDTVDEDEKASQQRAKERKMKDMPRTPQKVLVTAVRTSKAKAAAFNVYFDQRSNDKTEKTAVQWFKRFSGRAPNDAELSRIRSFTQTDAEELTEKEYVVPTYSLSGCDEDDDEDTAQQKKVSAKDLVTKQSATSYTLHFEGEADNANGDEKAAVQWFARFNKREPTAEDRARIASFLGGDDKTDEKNDDDEDEETIDID